MKFGDIENWSDAECAKFDTSSSRFPIKLSRNLLQEYNRLSKLHDELCEEYNRLWKILTGGKFFGYTIQCPYCGVEYSIPHKDLNIHQIQCMDCGNWYSQNRSVVKILVYDEEVK